MRSLACPTCRARVYFENDRCLACGTSIGFRPDAFVMEAVEVVPGPGGEALSDWFRCANAGVAGCNWVVPSAEQGGLCPSCALTRTRPPDGDDEGHVWFVEAETAKRRLVAQLFDLGLPVVGFAQAEDGLAFDLLTSRFDDVTTGHEDGLITVDLAEADDAHRERVRNQLGEAYRTVLGHFRHEVGHYYWMVLVRDGGHLEQFRALFGDERADYGDAMSAHYGGDGPSGWEEQHVSAYATMHPWEDWAETFAHLLHMRDTLQTAAENGVKVAGSAAAEPPVSPGVAATRSGTAGEFAAMVAEWLALTGALNELNRSMGAPDLYPFVLSPTVIGKLTFVDDLVRSAATALDATA